ncbi:MAG: N-acetylmuramoyl-L-alanine amidase [Rhodospirillaceae bacterium]|nr:N-acetylmuramoyl-L-alanine amidase [Rhodospirillaceae bacterium]
MCIAFLKRAIFLSFVSCLCWASVGSAGAEIVARDIRIGVHKSKTRVVLDLTTNVKFTIFALADPYRIVLDLPDIRWQVPAAAARRNGGLIAGLRYGQYQPGKSRVVLDLRAPGTVGKSFMLPPGEGYGPRLVIDIKNVSRKAFLASIRPPAKKVPRATQKIVLKPTRKPAERPLVVIDPGHGGVDPGAIGISGIFEKRVTLAMARQVGKAIQALGRQRVRLTRNRDIFIPLRRRVAIARAAGAELFVSIHADSIATRRVRGGGIYTLSENSSDKEAAALAAKENRADLIAGVNLSGHDDEVASILIDLTQRETMNYSAQFAAALVPELRQLIQMRRKPHRFAGFVVLKAPDVPSVLIELGYLSNRRDEKMLTSPRSRAAIAKAIARSVDNYFRVQKR